MTDGEHETVVSASLQKIKSIKNPIKHFLFFYFIKSETSDSFVNHFNGHFAYLKTLDFCFKVCMEFRHVWASNRERELRAQKGMSGSVVLSSSSSIIKFCFLHWIVLLVTCVLCITGRQILSLSKSFIS